MPPRAGFDRHLFRTVSRPGSSFIEIETHFGRALLLALKSFTMHRRTKAHVRMFCQRRSASRGHETYRKIRPKSWGWRPRSVLGTQPRVFTRLQHSILRWARTTSHDPSFTSARKRAQKRHDVLDYLPSSRAEEEFLTHQP